MEHYRKTRLPIYTEPTVIQDVYLDGWAHISACRGECVRMTGFVELPFAEAPDEIEHRILARIIMPREIIPGLQILLSQVLVARAYSAIANSKNLLEKLGH